MKAEILIVDDEKDITEIVSFLLTKAGHHCACAHDVERAWEIVTEAKPALILCDISMPKKTGLDFLAEIRLANIGCSVVMMTAFSEPDRILEALRLGATDYITKPFDYDSILIKVAVWLEMGRRYKSLNDSENESDLKRSLSIIDQYRVKAASNGKLN